MATQTASQNRQSALDALDSIGSSRGNFNEASIMSAGEKDVAAFLERVQANINASGMILTGNIAEMSVRVLKDYIQVLGNDYLKYQDEGVQGSETSIKAPNSPFKYRDKMPPLNVFIEYVKRKNLHLRNQAQFFEGESPFADADGDEKAIKTIAVLIQKKVFKEGFRPRNVFKKEIPKLKEDLKKSIKDFGANAIKEVFKFK